jgi:hypothetical protein
MRKMALQLDQLRAAVGSRQRERNNRIAFRSCNRTNRALLSLWIRQAKIDDKGADVRSESRDVDPFLLRQDGDRQDVGGEDEFDDAVSWFRVLNGAGRTYRIEAP